MEWKLRDLNRLGRVDRGSGGFREAGGEAQAEADSEAESKEDRAEVALLRPESWFADNGVSVVGDCVELDLEELDLAGAFQVLELGEVRVSTYVRRAGFGRVTGRFQFNKGATFNLFVAGESRPIGVTGQHPFWSADRNAWVSVRDLRIGERMLVEGGTRVVEKVEVRGEEVVFNIEVEGEHCYRVGEQGVLVHNASDECSKASPKLRLGEARHQYRYIDVNVNRSGGKADWEPEKVIKSVRFLLKNRRKIAQLTGDTEPDFDAKHWIQDVVGRHFDNAGHAVGFQFGGSGHIGNIYPQHWASNQTWQRTRENRVMAEARGKNTCRICIYISLAYDEASPMTYYRARPTMITYDVRINGKPFQPWLKLIDNPSI